jgi:hypothetical protein
MVVCSDGALLSFSPEGPVLAVRPCTHNDHDWQVWFDTNRTIVDVFKAANYPLPESAVRMISVADNRSAARKTVDTVRSGQGDLAGQAATAAVDSSLSPADRVLTE